MFPLYYLEMHTSHRLLIVAVLLALIVPLGSTALLLSGNATQEEYDRAMRQLQAGYRTNETLSLTTDTAERVTADLKEKLTALDKRKRELRMEVAVLVGTLQSLDRRKGDLAAEQDRTHLLLGEEKEKLAAFLRHTYVQHVVDASTGPVAGRLLLQRMFGMSVGGNVENDLRSTALANARSRLMTRLLQTNEFASLSQEKLHAAAGEWAEKLHVLQAEREKVLQEYRNAQRAYDRAQSTLVVSQEQLEEIERITREVQDDVLRMQSELARIDARLRSKAERELIQRGLRTPRPGRYREKDEEEGSSQVFAWPASGPISAGFHNEAYQRHFHVPHQGIDIVVPHGTEVRSAAHGIVFLVRPGGARGYTYVLIGHRDGYATLYGHLSSVSVANGQEVTRGQVIGLSGGTPGTDGAGPMTTGAHLHFEMLKNGAHVDPQSALPR